MEKKLGDANQKLLDHAAFRQQVFELASKKILADTAQSDFDAETKDTLNTMGKELQKTANDLSSNIKFIKETLKRHDAYQGRLDNAKEAPTMETLRKKAKNPVKFSKAIKYAKETISGLKEDIEKDKKETDNLINQGEKLMAGYKSIMKHGSAQKAGFSSKKSDSLENNKPNIKP